MAKGAKPMWDRFPVFYHRRLPPHRLAKRILAAVGALLAVVWIAAALVRRDEQPFSSGAMSVGHAMLVDNCRACHTPDTAFRRFQHWSDADMAHAMNRACLDCHGNVVGFDPRTLSAWHQVGPHEVSVGAGGAVSGPQEPAVACSACHTEHRGFVRLTQLDDRQCTSCHADLDRARPGQPYYPHIAAFDPTRTSADRAHPEFRFKQENWVDRAAIRFNHAIHLRTDPLGADDPNSPRGIPNYVDGGHVVMRCDDCHRAGRSNLPWRFAAPWARADGRTLVADTQSGMQDPFMAPISFDLHCAGCHLPSVGRGGDLLLPSERAGLGQVPHGVPGDVRAYVEQRLLVYLNMERSRLPKPDLPDDFGEPPDTSNMPPEQATRVKLEYINETSRIMEKRLFGGGALGGEQQLAARVGCAFCHSVRFDGETPHVEPTNIPERWLRHASFNHLRHREVGSLRDALERPGGGPLDRNCLHCHAGVLTSEKTEDVSLPGIAVCLDCHAVPRRFGGAMTGGVSHACVYCHSFHRPPAPPGAPGQGSSSP